MINWSQSCETQTQAVERLRTLATELESSDTAQEASEIAVRVRDLSRDIRDNVTWTMPDVTQHNVTDALIERGHLMD